MGVVWEQGAGKGRENAPILSFEVGCCPIVHLPDLGEHTPHLGEREGGRERERDQQNRPSMQKHKKGYGIIWISGVFP